VIRLHGPYSFYLAKVRKGVLHLYGCRGELNRIRLDLEWPDAYNLRNLLDAWTVLRED